MEKGTRQAVDSAGSGDDEKQGSQRTDSLPAEDHHQQARGDENVPIPAEEPPVPEKRNDVRAVPLWKQSSINISLNCIQFYVKCTMYI